MGQVRIAWSNLMNAALTHTARAAEGKEDWGNLFDMNCRKTGQMGELI